jgi:hypothetical protein
MRLNVPMGNSGFFQINSVLKVKKVMEDEKWGWDRTHAFSASKVLASAIGSGMWHQKIICCVMLESEWNIWNTATRGKVGPTRPCITLAFKFHYIKIKVKLPLCLTKHHAMKLYWGSGCIAPFVLNLVTRWWWVISFTPRGKSPTVPTGQKAG